jgi:hypothetical protein
MAGATAAYFDRTTMFFSLKAAFFAGEGRSRGHSVFGLYQRFSDHVDKSFAHDIAVSSLVTGFVTL